MIGLWLHEMGARVVAFPFRIVIGLVFINIGLQSVAPEQMGVAEGAAPLLNLADFGFDASSWGSTGVGMLLILAGALSIVGMFVRIVGGVLFFVVITNMFAGFESANNMADMILLLQNRMLLAVCAMVLFFLGSGIFSLDGIIFRAIGGIGGDDDKKGKDGGGGGGH